MSFKTVIFTNIMSIELEKAVDLIERAAEEARITVEAGVLIPAASVVVEANTLTPAFGSRKTFSTVSFSDGKRLVL